MTSSPLEMEAHRWRVLKEQLLQEFPDLVEDEQVLFDTLEGETDLKEKVAELARSAQMDEAMAEACKVQEKRIANRRGNLTRRADKKRAFLLNLMIDLDLPPVKVGDVSVSKRKTRPKLLTDENKVSKHYKIKEVTYKLNKDLIHADLKAGKTIEGANLSNGGMCLTIKI